MPSCCSSKKSEIRCEDVLKNANLCRGVGIGKTGGGAVHPAQLAQRSRHTSASDDSQRPGGAVGGAVELSTTGACVVPGASNSAGDVVTPRIVAVGNSFGIGAEVVSTTSGSIVASVSGKFVVVGRIGGAVLDSRSVVGSTVGVLVGCIVGDRVGATVGCNVGQRNILHAIVSVVLPQSSSEPATTERSRVFVPPSQSAVHDPHSPHSPSKHVSLQSCKLHSYTSSTSVSFTAQVPPFVAGVMVRFRTIKPPPHCCVHSENALQSETSQSCGT